MKLPIDNQVLASVLKQMDILDISSATIRQSGGIARALESCTSTEFLHLEMGIPGLPPVRAGIEAEKSALDSGVASQYPSMQGLPKLKEQASRFLKAFLDIDLSALSGKLLSLLREYSSKIFSIGTNLVSSIEFCVIGCF